MNQSKLTKNLLIVALVTLLVLMAAAVFVQLPKWRFGLAQPVTRPEPSPTPAPTAEPIASAPPKAAAVSYEMPAGAVDVLVSRRVLFAMESAAAAETLLTEYLQAASAMGLAENETLLKAALTTELALRPAGGTHPLLGTSEVMERLLENPDLIPLSREVARCEEVLTELPVQSTATRALPKGSRMIVSPGTQERWLVYSETSLKGSMELNYRETNRFRVGEESPKTLRLGSYENKIPGTIGRDEGANGREPKERLRFVSPLGKRSFSAYYGWRGGTWHSGIDYKGEPGARVLAPEGGVVIFCGERGDYGYVIDILLADSGFVARLAHCADVRVELWERVSKGQHIATLKAADPVENTSLHLEFIVDGVPVNPLQYM